MTILGMEFAASLYSDAAPSNRPVKRASVELKRKDVSSWRRSLGDTRENFGSKGRIQFGCGSRIGNRFGVFSPKYRGWWTLLTN